MRNCDFCEAINFEGSVIHRVDCPTGRPRKPARRLPVARPRSDGLAVVCRRRRRERGPQGGEMCRSCKFSRTGIEVLPISGHTPQLFLVTVCRANPPNQEGKHPQVDEKHWCGEYSYHPPTEQKWQRLSKEWVAWALAHLKKLREGGESPGG